MHCRHTEAMNTCVYMILVYSKINPWLRSCSKQCCRKRRHQPSLWAWYRYFRCIVYPLKACNPWSPEITAPCGQLSCNHIISQEREKGNFKCTACTVHWMCESYIPKRYHFLKLPLSHDSQTNKSNHLVFKLSGLSHFLCYYCVFTMAVHQLPLWWQIIDFNRFWLTTSFFSNKLKSLNEKAVT